MCENDEANALSGMRDYARASSVSVGLGFTAGIVVTLKLVAFFFFGAQLVVGPGILATDALEDFSRARESPPACPHPLLRRMRMT